MSGRSAAHTMFDPAGVKKAAAAERQRRSRAKRKGGLRGVRLYLPMKRIEAAIRVRNGLTPGTTLSPDRRDRALAQAIGWWCDCWLAIKHHHKLGHK
jgi:hypothetical protein